MLSKLSRISELFPLKVHRENRIIEQAQRHLNGELSYWEARKNSQSSGILEWFSSAIYGGNSMSESEINTQFEAVLMESQLQNAINNFNMLMYHVLNPELYLSDQSCYQQFFSNIEVNNSQCELRLSFDVYDDGPVNGLVMTLTKYDRNTNKVDNMFKPKTHFIPNYDLYELRDVLIEHAIYQHKQHGIAIPDLVKGLTDDQNRINIYLEEAALYQYGGICFPGGGAKGVIVAGAVESLGEYRLANVRKVSGASAGAIIAAIISCGMKPYEFTEFMHKANLDITQDELIAVVRNAMLSTIRKRLYEFNLNHKSGDMDQRQIYYINKYNSPQVSLTFDDLYQLNNVFPHLGFKELYLTATHFTGNDPVGVELSVQTAPNMEIAKAVAASAALPWWFGKVDVTDDLLPEIKEKLKVADGKSVQLEDGGIVKNNPADLLTRDTRRLSIDLLKGNISFDSFFVDDNIESKDDDFEDDSEIDESKYDESKEEINIGDNINNNLLKKEISILSFVFEDSKGLHETSPSLIEKASCFFVGTDKMPGYQRYEIYRLLEKYNVHFLRTLGIGTIDFKSATRRFIEITQHSKNDLTEWEVGRRGKVKVASLFTERQYTQDVLLREVFAMRFGDDKIEKQVLTKKREMTMSDGTLGESTLFKELCEAHDNNAYKKFNKLYQQLRRETSSP